MSHEVRDRIREVVDNDAPRAWVTKGSYARETAVRRTDDQNVALFVDCHTRTRFPADAAIPLGKLREALQEFAQTGLRPTCVDWQESDVS